MDRSAKEQGLSRGKLLGEEGKGVVEESVGEGGVWGLDRVHETQADLFMMTMSWPELSGEVGESRGDRQEAVQASVFPGDWFDPEALVEACEGAAREPLAKGLVTGLSGMGMPVEDVLATALSTRAALLGAKAGRCFYHHELRVRIPMPEGLEPEVRVSADEGTVPVWRGGVLDEPKYFSFFQDAPLPSYNPNHRGKWRAHELLHGVQGYFWGPSMTRFECYLGARLNELLPVVHWYGLDEVLRPRCEKHPVSNPNRAFCADCEQAATQPYWAHEAAWMEGRREESRGLVRAAAAHMQAEWAACLQELESGRRVVVRHLDMTRAHLDASSDAVGYLKGHWNRLTAWSFGAWTERFLMDGEDYFSDLTAYASKITKVARELVSGPLTLDPAAFERLRARKVLQDVAYRAHLLLEHFEDGSAASRRAEDALKPHLDHIARLCRMFWDATAKPDPRREVPATIRGLIQSLDDALKPLHGLPDHLKERFLSLGYVWPNASLQTGLPATPHFTARDQLLDGLRSACPKMVAQIKDENVLKELASDFAASPSFASARDLLASRFATWYDSHPQRDIYAAALANFEAWTALPPLRDEEAEDFGVLPESTDQLAHGTLRCHLTLRVDEWPAWIAAETLEQDLDDDDDEWDSVYLAVIWHNGELRAAQIDPDTAELCRAIQNQEDFSSWFNEDRIEALELLLENSFLVWLPLPKH